jgi:hypothetical protein
MYTILVTKSDGFIKGETCVLLLKKGFTDRGIYNKIDGIINLAAKGGVRLLTPYPASKKSAELFCYSLIKEHLNREAKVEWKNRHPAHIYATWADLTEAKQ